MNRLLHAIEIFHSVSGETYEPAVRSLEMASNLAEQRRMRSCWGALVTRSADSLIRRWKFIHLHFGFSPNESCSSSPYLHVAFSLSTSKLLIEELLHAASAGHNVSR